MSGVPQNIIVPFIGIEFDSSGAFSGPSTLPFKVLVMGHQDSVDGILVDDTPTLILNADDAALKCGVGSQLHQSLKRWFARNAFTEVYAVAVPEASGSAATYTYTITGTATESGTLPIMIDGKQVSVGIVIDEDADAAAAGLSAAINDVNDQTTFTSAEDTGVITLTANYVGALGDDHDVRDTYFDTDAIPAGLSVVVAAVAGAGDADITDSIAGMVNQWYNIIVCPFQDATNLNLMETEMARRFGPTVQQDGIVYIGYNDTAANTITFSTNSLRNSQSVSVVDAYKYTEHYMYVATYVAAECAKSVQGDIGQPLHRITIDSLLPPVAVDRHDITTLNTLTVNGVCTLDPHASGGPQTFGMVTMYLKNSAGVNDIAYQYQTTMFILMFLRYDTIVRLGTKYARARLADDASRIRAGIQVLTPVKAKAEFIALAREWEEAGLVENIDQFKKDLVVQRSSTNPNRLDFIQFPDLVNQNIVNSGVNKFLLQ